MAIDDAKSDLLWVVGMVVLLGVLWFATGGPQRQTGGPLIKPSAVEKNNNTNDSDITPTPEPSLNNYESAGDNYPPAISATTSPYVGQFSIQKGSASSAYQPNREYISISYRGDTPVDVTGWYLTNNKSGRAYESGGNLIRLMSDVVRIPRVTKLFIGGGQNSLDSDIIMTKNGELAIVTGSMAAADPFPVSTNFQENICTGYIDDLPDYNFSPSLGHRCPDPLDFPGAMAMADDCYNYLRSVGSCRTPDFDQNPDTTFKDSRLNKLTSICRDFVRKNLNYNGCVAIFAEQPDFYLPTWRVYLNRPWELWNNQRDTITLYDNQGKLVTKISY